MTEYYIWILQFMGIANPRSIQLLRHFGTAENVYIGVNDSNLHFLKETEKNAYKTASLEKSKEIIEKAKSEGFSIITLDDACYPELLKNINDPPIVIFIKGNIKDLNEKTCLTVIGTRNPCEYSYRVIESICGPLALNGIAIISGMAVGIDKAAHTSALKAGGITIGVLACGFDIDYPRGSKVFRDEIVNCGGAVLTEQLPGSRAESWYFQRRNRILSGLSHGTLVVEADAKSGCIITANHACDQNRDLFCIPPRDIFDPRYSGVVPFLRDGAIPVFGYRDILDNYFIKDKSTLNISKCFIPASDDEPKTSFSQNISLNLSDNQERIYNILKNSERTMDFLIEQSGLDADAVNEAILELEIDGIIKNIGGSAYKISG